MAPQRQQWLRALSAVTDAVDRAKHGDAVDTAAWCAATLRTRHRVTTREQVQARLTWLEEHGDTAAALAVDLPGDPRDDKPRDAVIRAHRGELARAGLRAWDTAQLVAVAQWAMRAQLIEEAAVWPRLALAGHRCQEAYDSWRSFADGHELGRRFASGGQLHKASAQATTVLLDGADSPWRTLPWRLDLGVTGAKAKARFRRAVCPSCGGDKSQPSRTSYVYCDYCGELCDYDFDRAAEPAIDEDRWRRRAELASQQTAAAHRRGDHDAYRRAQADYWEAYADAFPGAVSPRIVDPIYRRAWIEYQAECATRWAFDAEAQRVDQALVDVVSGLVYVEVKGQPKLVAQTFGPVLDAALARRAYSGRLLGALLSRHPDGISPIVSQRIASAQFVQQWLPYLDEDTLRTTIERLGMSADYDRAAAPGTRARVGCSRCGVVLEIAAGARRVVCEHCGHRIDLVAPRAL